MAKAKTKITQKDADKMKAAFHRQARIDAGVYHKPAHQVFQSKKKRPGKKVKLSDFE